MPQLLRTVFYDRHVELKGSMVEFGGWEMPVQYQPGIIEEHLITRKRAGLFDVSHMGRFVFKGNQAVSFLQHTLTNNAAALEVGQSQYTLIPNENGGAVDDAYLYRFFEEEYLLVVNASNRDKDWAHFNSAMNQFPNVEMADKTGEIAMVSLQGPKSREIMLSLITSGALPEPLRNYLSVVDIGGTDVWIARTGYTGEPLCFELFFNTTDAVRIWDKLLAHGAVPIGLGARDTLRLEAGLPLYGHELGPGPGGGDIPIFASPLSRFAVSFSPLKNNYIGRVALEKQFTALKGIFGEHYELVDDLPQIVMPLLLTDKGIARAGDKVCSNGTEMGTVTSGTMVPYWIFDGDGIEAQITGEKGRRAVCLALLDSRVKPGDFLEIEIRRNKCRAQVVPYHLRSEAPPYAHPMTDLIHTPDELQTQDELEGLTKVRKLVDKSISNTVWRQQECINLIPSEMTASVITRLLSVMDPVGRYAEHKTVKAFGDADVFYYQGTEFIAEVESLLVDELKRYLGCREVETRVVSGQMANTAVFSGLVDFLNRADRKSEQRRMRSVMNHHIIKGGHLSAQPMGALRDFVCRDPKTEKPAVVNFPVLDHNPYCIDVEACRDIIEEYKPELIILGKSMILHKEPVAQIREFVDELSPDSVLMYDMAHVLGLVGPHFQEPFAEGADIVTGSTHKTFFGTQRGIVGVNYTEADYRYEFWEAIQRRSFPGSVSNHHPGTLLGLLLATYEMNAFKDEYQKNIIANAKAFARALADCGLDVAGDPSISFTETHQVVLKVGYARGAEIAKHLEENNIVANYQAAPEEEGFTASGSIRMGVSEMTRFGMKPADFQQLAQFIHDVVVGRKNVKHDVTIFRKRFVEMKYCYCGNEVEDLVESLHRMM
ncbi:MAG: glycine cleavage system aminomethyltransferase GcvT [Desulfobacteraceae bacterium]|nr:glycine cleavage system aminomethyltransferase GcvT [Desulfobacteraceae bacterium]